LNRSEGKLKKKSSPELLRLGRMLNQLYHEWLRTEIQEQFEP
jgi:hypothetical protein